MTAGNSLPIQHDMVRLRRDEYPYWRGQPWADPSVEHAYALLRPVLDDAARGRAIAERGQAEVLVSPGNRAQALRILARLEGILGAARRCAARWSNMAIQCQHDDGDCAVTTMA